MRTLKKDTKFKNIFFDFDGVIAESVNCKTQAFKELYLPYGDEVANKVVEHHIHHGGVSRFEKFKIYHKQFLGQDITESKIQELANAFSDLVLEKVINSEEVTGFSNFVKQYHRHINFWVITGTPTSEIEEIVNARNICDFFIGLHGSPENKEYWTEYLIETHKLDREATLFLGDATTDQNAANFSNLHFALREHDENTGVFKNYNGLRFRNYIELETLITGHL